MGKEWVINWQHDFLCPKCGAYCDGEENTMSFSKEQCIRFCSHCSYVHFSTKNPKINLTMAIISTKVAVEVLGLKKCLC